jgi:hypothetical protein
VHPIRNSRKAFLATLCGVLPYLAFAVGALAQASGEPVVEGRSSLGYGGRAAWLARLSIHPRVIEPGIAPARPASFFDDTTLRRGDVVVTPDGLMVFRGSKRFPYASSDFDSVRSPAAVRATHAPELIELQRAHERGKP